MNYQEALKRLEDLKESERRIMDALKPCYRPLPYRGPFQRTNIADGLCSLRTRIQQMERVVRSIKRWDDMLAKQSESDFKVEIL